MVQFNMYLLNKILYIISLIEDFKFYSIIKNNLKHSVLKKIKKIIYFFHILKTN